jgi:acetylornithine deacetylase
MSIDGAPSESVVVDLLSGLVAIDSVNPDLVPGGVGESELAAFCWDWLIDRGCEVHRQSTGRPGRENVVGVVGGSGGGRALMLNAHMDTVGVSAMDRPHDPQVRDGRLYGRGALDTKGGLAAFMLAVASVVEGGLRGDVILTAVVDEEFASTGTEAVLRDWRADGPPVAEPTRLGPVPGDAFVRRTSASLSARDATDDITKGLSDSRQHIVYR